MPQNKPILVVLLIVPLMLFMSNAEEPHESQTRDFLGKIINFLVLFGGLTYLLRKPLGNFLQRRADSLKKMLRGAKESREEAMEKLAGVESRLGNIDKEIEQLRREAETEGQTLYQGIIEEAKQDTERLKHFARREIEMLTQVAIRDIRKHTADLATKLAQQSIQDRITEEYQSTLIDKSIERLEKLYEKSNSDKKVRSRTH
jgi:F-type H+-transporting ATPase subunit b